MINKRKVTALYDPTDVSSVQITDISLSFEGQEKSILGEGGAQREIVFIDTALSHMPAKCLPVLLGSGVGFALEHLINAILSKNGQHSPLLIIDKEDDILEVSKVKEKFKSHTSICWVSEKNIGVALKEMTQWQCKNGNLPLFSFSHPFYLRLDKAYYSTLKKACDASCKNNFWDKVAYPRFKGDKARILLLTSKYFLIGEFEAALQRMDIPYQLLKLPEDTMEPGDFIEQLLQAVVSFKPDFALTINHLGVDREGLVVELFENIKLPLASWFVDNPHLILSMYKKLVSPWTAIFTWDVDNLQSLSALGFSHVNYLPLGTDDKRFHPGISSDRKDWNADISFVGNSMVYKVMSRKEKLALPKKLADNMELLGSEFSDSEERSVSAFLRNCKPDLYDSFASIPGIEQRLHFEAMLTWEATKQYRLSCVASTFKYTPLIVGDKGWHDLVPKNVEWRYLAEVNYYHDLPKFYPCSSINFNCTSKQMKGAVNQRVFDVPATGAFLLTDYREQVENLFELGKEIICYQSPEEAESLIERYLHTPSERIAVAKAARKRILACHTYEHRMASLICTMRSIFG